MKIVHLSYSDTMGGAAIGAYRLHRAMHHRGVDTEMRVIHKGSDDATVRSLLNNRNSATYGELSRASNALRALYEIEDLPIRTFNLVGVNVADQINAMAPDIVQMHWIANNTIRLSDLQAIEAPIVWKMPDMWPFSGAEHYIRHGDPERFADGYDVVPPFNNEAIDLDQMVWQHKRQVYRNLDLTIVSPSRFLADCAHRSVLMRDFDCHVIPNPLPWTFTSSPPATAREQRELRQALSLPQHKTLVSFAAYSTDEKRKGYHHIADMVREFLPDRVGPHELAFLVIGGGVARQDRLGDYDVFFFPSTNNEATYRDYMRAANVFLFPSEMDSTAMVVQEALALGVPAIVFDVGGLPEMVEHEHNGFVATPYEPRELADGLAWWHHLEEERREEVRHFATQRSKVMQDPNACVSGYLALYEDLLRNGTTGAGRLVEAPPVDLARIHKSQRVHILDPSAVKLDESSHNAAHTLAFAASFNAGYATPTLVINAAASLENPYGETLTPFDWTIYDKVRASQGVKAWHSDEHRHVAEAMDASCEESWQIYESLVCLAAEHSFTANDAVVFPTVDRFCVEGLLLFLFGHTSQLMPSFHLNIMFEKAQFLRGAYPLAEMLANLSESGYLDRRVFLYTETAQMAADLKAQFGMTFYHRPPPSLFAAEDLDAMGDAVGLHDKARESYRLAQALKPARGEQAGTGNGFTVAALGRGRRDKGWDLLPVIVAAFNDRHGGANARFIAQAPREMDGLDDERQAMAGHANVELLPEIIETDALDALVASADVVLLPYNKGVYRNRGSAFCWQASAGAVPMVVAAGTALEESLIASDELDADEITLHNGGGATAIYANGIATSTPDGYADAIATIMNNAERFASGARLARERYYRASVLDCAMKRNMRIENHFSAPRELVIARPEEPFERAEPGRYFARLNVTAADVPSYRRQSLFDPHASCLFEFAVHLADGAALSMADLPSPLRDALSTGTVRKIYASRALAINTGALRALPERLLNRLELF